MRTSYVPFTLGENNVGCMKHGVIELYEMIQLEVILKNGYPTIGDDEDDSNVKDTNQINDNDNNNNIDSNNSLICLLLAPSFMIPRDILHYFNTYVSAIISVHILRHSSDMEKYLALMMMESKDAAMNLIRDFHGELLTSLEPVMTKCMLYFVKEVHAQPIDIINSGGTSLHLYSNQMKLIINDNDHETSNELDNLIGFVEKTRSVSDLDFSATLDIGAKQKNLNWISLMRLSHEDQTCPVCLEPISETNPLSFTTCCNHTFHITCIYKTEGPQCPVCRFQHDSTPISMSQCVMCSWNGEDNEKSTNIGDLWICLVCGFIGCGSSNCFHIRDHYQSLLHAYAMNVENGRVWDFAGDGYVHRLIMQHSDADYPHLGSSEDDDNVLDPLSSSHLVEARTQPKMVEVPDPRSRLSSRTRQAPLTTDEESLLVNRKLESTAYHYNQLLTWQLEHNRQRYEDRLHRFKVFLSQELHLANTKDNSKSWSQTMEELLLIEKSKALKKRDLALSRFEEARNERTLLQEFNKNLLNNLTELQGAIATAEDKVFKAENVYSDYIPKLEKKVQSLMEKL